jgi:hypothetical protein
MKHWLRRPWGWTLIAGVIAAAAIVAVAAAGASSPTAPPWSPTSASDVAAIDSAVASVWAAGEQIVTPTLSRAATGRGATAKGRAAARAARRDMNRRYEEVIRQVGTAEYVAQASGLNVGKAILADYGVGNIPIREETQILDSTCEGTLSNGDVVMWLRLWNGDIAQHWPSGAIGSGTSEVSRVDTTPTWQYVMREVDGEWKIVSEDLVYDSEDTSPLYGPDTPHWVAEQARVSPPPGASQPVSLSPASSPSTP